MIIVKNKKWKILCVLLAFCMVVPSGCKPAVTDTPPSSETAEGNLEDDDRQTTEIIVPNGKEDVPEENKDEKNEEEQQVTQTKPFWQSQTSLHYENLKAVAAAAQQDYRMTGARRGWMSKNGKLYGYYDGCYITPAMLVKEGYLQSGLDTTGYEILLIKGSDLSQLSGANVSSGNMGLGMFAAVKQNNKYLIAAPGGKIGQVSQEDYTALLAKYNQSHGTVGRLSSSSAEYDRILNYICLYEGKFEDFYVREIRKDNKYAMVVFSPASNSADVREYILQNDNGFWEVVYPNLQTQAYPLHEVNKVLPDFNVGLLPGYNLAAWRGLIKTETGGAQAAMFSKHFISSKSQIAYQCAISNCAYFVLKDGSRYVSYLDGNYWTAAAVSSDIEAKNYFIEHTGVDYSFIILDD